jgi:hypothetical protein
MLLVFTAVLRVRLIATITILVMVGLGTAPNPNGSQRLPGLPNRLFMSAWLYAA